MSDNSRCVNLVRFINVKIPLAIGAVILDYKKVISLDDEFIWRGVSGRQSDGFSLRFNVNDRYYLSNARVPMACGFNTGVRSRGLTPEFVIPAGGNIGIEIENTSGVAMTARFVLVGVLRRML